MSRFFQESPSLRDLEAFPTKYESTIAVLTPSDQQTSLAVFHQLLTNRHLQLKWVFFLKSLGGIKPFLLPIIYNLFMISLPNTRNSCRVATECFFRYLDIGWGESAIINLLEKNNTTITINHRSPNHFRFVELNLQKNAESISSHQTSNKQNILQKF